MQRVNLISIIFSVYIYMFFMFFFHFSCFLIAYINRYYYFAGYLERPANRPSVRMNERTNETWHWNVTLLLYVYLHNMLCLFTWMFTKNCVSKMMRREEFCKCGFWCRIIISRHKLLLWWMRRWQYAICAIFIMMFSFRILSVSVCVSKLHACICLCIHEMWTLFFSFSFIALGKIKGILCEANGKLFWARTNNAAG